MDSKEFRELLVEMVKASGQEVIDRAEDIVGDGEMLSDFDIWLRFPIDGWMFDGVPTIQVNKEYVSKNGFDVLDKALERRN